MTRSEPKRRKSTLHPEAETRLALLEQSVLMQNTTTNERLGEIMRVNKEIHDKLDTHLLEQAVQTTQLKDQSAVNASEIEKTNKRFNVAGGVALTLLVALVGAAATVMAG